MTEDVKVNEYPPEMDIMHIMEAELKEMEAEEKEAAPAEEATDALPEKKDKKEEPTKEETITAKPEDKPEEPAKEETPTELTQAQKDHEDYKALFAKRAAKRAEEQPAQSPAKTSKQETLIARIIANGDPAAVNDLLTHLGPEKFDEVIKLRLASMGATEPAPEPTDDKASTEVQALRKELQEFKQQQSSQQVNAVKEHQLNLIKDVISTNPEEYSMSQGYEEQIRTLALEFMADGNEKSAVDVVRIFNNSLLEDLRNRLNPAALKQLGISQASVPSTPTQKEPTGKKLTPISNSTETINSPSERDDRDMPVDMDDRLKWAFEVARKENIELE